MEIWQEAITWTSNDQDLWPYITSLIHCVLVMSTLSQTMAYCLMAPSHYLNQCWLIIIQVLWHSPKCNFTGNVLDINLWYTFEKYIIQNYMHNFQRPMPSATMSKWCYGIYLYSYVCIFAIQQTESLKRYKASPVVHLSDLSQSIYRFPSFWSEGVPRWPHW